VRPNRDQAYLLNALTFEESGTIVRDDLKVRLTSTSLASLQTPLLSLAPLGAFGRFG